MENLPILGGARPVVTASVYGNELIATELLT